MLVDFAIPTEEGSGTQYNRMLECEMPVRKCSIVLLQYKSATQLKLHSSNMLVTYSFYMISCVPDPSFLGMTAQGGVRCHYRLLAPTLSSRSEAEGPCPSYVISPKPASTLKTLLCSPDFSFLPYCFSYVQKLLLKMIHWSFLPALKQ